MSDAVQTVLSHLPDARPAGHGRWTARCPAHDDRKPSLSVAIGEAGRALIKCHAGCPLDAILDALGLQLHDLFCTHESAPRAEKAETNHGNNGSDRRNTVYPTAAEAIAEVEKRFGRCSARWEYQHENGEPAGLVLRWETPSGKRIRPVSRTPDGWVLRGMPSPRPLYRLPELLRSTGPVYLTEGEKAAEAARLLGLTATTSPHGSGAYAHADWSPLAGRRVVLLPDNDAAGHKYVEGVATQLQQLDPPPAVRLLRLPGLPEGGDIVEFIQAREQDGKEDEAMRAELEALAETATEFRPLPKGYQFRPISSAAFAAGDYRPRWLVKRLFVEAQPAIVGGPKKRVPSDLRKGCVGTSRLMDR